MIFRTEKYKPTKKRVKFREENFYSKINNKKYENLN
jgi:hypothetical protein